MDQKKSGLNRYVVLALLTIVYAFNFVDRQVMGILAPFIQADLGLSDGQIGLLSGLAFAMFYSIISVPIAALADKHNRVTIISASLVVWSGFTALSGYASNFAQLAMARMGVGVGEAGGSPPSHAIISDLFKKEERATALGIYSLGIPFGIMAAYFASAAMMELGSQEGGGDMNWRAVFFVLGVPGIIFGIFLKLIVKDPPRGQSENITLKSENKSSFKDTIRQLVTIPSWWGMCGGIGFASFGGYALGAFVMVLLIRFHQPAPVEIPNLLKIFGVVNGTFYAAGVFVGGYVADKWGKKNVGGYALAPAIALIIGVPPLLAAFWTPELNVSIALIGIYLFFSGFFIGPSFSIAQTLAPINVRATSTALFFLFLNMVAMGGGPTYVGYASEYLSGKHGDIVGLQWAMTSLGLFYLISILCFFWTARKLPKDWADAEARNKAQAG